MNREKTYQDLSKEDQKLYDQAIGAAQEGYQFGKNGAIEAVAKFALTPEHLNNPGVLMAIRDANPERRFSDLGDLLKNLKQK